MRQAPNTMHDSITKLVAMHGSYCLLQAFKRLWVKKEVVDAHGKDSLKTFATCVIFFNGGSSASFDTIGMMTFQDGKIVKYDNESGHFKPNVKSMPEADKAFSELPSTAFHRNFNKHMGRR